MVTEYYGNNRECRIDWPDRHFETLKRVFEERDKRRDIKWRETHGASLYFGKHSDTKKLKSALECADK